MANLNDTPSAGLLTAADLDAARRESTGRIYAFAQYHEAHTPAGYGYGNTDDCAPECAQHADPVPSGTHRQTLISRGWLWLLRTLG